MFCGLTAVLIVAWMFYLFHLCRNVAWQSKRTHNHYIVSVNIQKALMYINSWNLSQKYFNDIILHSHHMTFWQVTAQWLSPQARRWKTLDLNQLTSLKNDLFVTSFLWWRKCINTYLRVSKTSTKKGINYSCLRYSMKWNVVFCQDAAQQLCPKANNVGKKLKRKWVICMKLNPLPLYQQYSLQA